MTRTETDLEQALLRRADRAPDEREVLARLERSLTAPTSLASRRRSTVPLVAAAAAAVVVAAAVGVWAGGSDGSGHRSDTGGTVSPNSSVKTDPALFAYTFRAGTPHGYTVESRTVEATRQTIVYSADRAAGAVAGEPDVLEAVVYARGAFDAATVRTGTPLRVDGRAGYFGPALGHVRAASGEESTATVPAVAWPYAADSWAVVHGVVAGTRTRAIELAVARTITPAKGADVRVAFRLGYVPDGLRAHTVTGDDTSSEVDLGRGDAARVVTVQAQAVQHQSVRALFGADRAPLSVAGRPAGIEALRTGSRTDGQLLTVLYDGFVVSVGGDTSVTRAELQAVATHLTVAPPGTAPGAWFPARTALPH